MLSIIGVDPGLRIALGLGAVRHKDMWGLFTVQYSAKAINTLVLCLILGSFAPAGEPTSVLPSLRAGMRWDSSAEDEFKESGARRFPCSYARGRSPAFTVSVELETELNRKVVPDDLRDGLSKYLKNTFDGKVKLSKNLTVEILDERPGWLVLDRDNRLAFHVEKRKGFRDKKLKLVVFFGSPFTADSYWTLPNGLSVRISTGKLSQKDPRRVTSLEFANSTILLACKGESWYPATGVELKQSHCQILGLDLFRVVAERGAEPPPVPVFLWKGMSEQETRRALTTAKLKTLPTPTAWSDKWPRTGRWLRCSLGNDRELAVNMGTGQSGQTPLVRWIILTVPKPGNAEESAGPYRIEFELIDLTKPLEENWGWAFRRAWSWDPSDPERMQRLREAGQRR